ncbi:MAG: EAL domain-containing protein [Pseudomonadota bacterium]
MLSTADGAIDGAETISPAELARRMSFYEIGPDELACLVEARATLGQVQQQCTQALHAHMLQFSNLSGMLAKENSLGVLAEAHRRYFADMTAGRLDQDYVDNRLRVGYAHQRIGLEPQWYLGAYRKYLSELMLALYRERSDDQAFLQTYDAVLKLICFDMSLAIDTYIHADRQHIVRLKDYAEQVIGSIPCGVMVIDLQGQVCTLNPAIEAMLDLPPGGPRQVGALVREPAIGRRIALGLERSYFHEEFVIANGNRHLRCLLSRAVLTGKEVLMLIAEDITVPLQARAALHDSEERFRVAFGQAAVGLAQIARDGRWLRVNRKLQQILGYDEAQLAHMRLQDSSLEEDRDADEQAMAMLASGACADVSRDKRCLHKDGHLVWTTVTMSPMRASDGELSFICVVEDISQRKAAELALLHQATHDALTGLANRALLQDRLDQAIAFARRAGHIAAVLFIDLDRFKNINDSLGHEAGDDVILEVGRRLQMCTRAGDTIARLGGDEFVLILPNLASGDQVAPLAQAVLDALMEPMVLGGHEVSPVASIGISLFPRDGADRQAMLKNADTALYRAKDRGRGCFQFYAQEMNARTLDRLALESRLRHALERREFVVHYQPQFDVASGAIVGTEALLRWQQADGSLLGPADFIPIAEETGLIVPIGEWVLRTACAQRAAWQAAGLPGVRMAVNLSVRQFQQAGLEAMIEAALRETGCRAEWLELEITESMLMDRPDEVAATLHRLNAMGVQLSIDDFGTGYSSLTYLKRFPIHALKIDRSFVLDVTTDEDAAAIARAIVVLAHSMKLTVVAEGVETQAQWDFLRAEACDQVQGFLMSRPVAADAIAALLAAGA